MQLDIKVKSKILLEVLIVTNQIVQIIDGFFKDILLTFDQRRLMFKKISKTNSHRNYGFIFHFHKCSNKANVEVALSSEENFCVKFNIFLRCNTISRQYFIFGISSCHQSPLNEIKQEFVQKLLNFIYFIMY